jgi:hypothetical protein
MWSSVFAEWLHYRLERRANRRVLRGRSERGVLVRGASELTLPRAERAAARAERRAEAAIRRERDNPETADRRAAAVEAERRRDGYGIIGGGL